MKQIHTVAKIAVLQLVSNARNSVLEKHNFILFLKILERRRKMKMKTIGFASNTKSGSMFEDPTHHAYYYDEAFSGNRTWAGKNGFRGKAIGYLYDDRRTCLKALLAYGHNLRVLKIYGRAGKS